LSVIVRLPVTPQVAFQDSSVTSLLPHNAGIFHARELFFLDAGISKELEEVYAKVERWKGIVASGVNPMIGNLEIPEITRGLSNRLPGLIEKLKQGLEPRE
jgi:hypothetical protein